MFTKLKEVSRECADDALCGVNCVTDVEQAQDLEKMHLPVIDAPRRVKKGQPFEIGIEIGGIVPHPNEGGHFIQFKELYAGENLSCPHGFRSRHGPAGHEGHDCSGSCAWVIEGVWPLQSVWHMGI